MTGQPRPKLKLPLTSLEIALEALTLIPLVMNFALLAFYWNTLPKVVATHFDLAGKANGWSAKETLLWIALFALGNYAAMTIISRFPHTFNYVWPITNENAQQQYLLARKFLNILKLEATVLIFFALWNCIQVSVGASAVADSTDLFGLLIMILISCLLYMFAAYRVK